MCVYVHGQIRKDKPMAASFSLSRLIETPSQYAEGAYSLPRAEDDEAKRCYCQGCGLLKTTHMRQDLWRLCQDCWSKTIKARRYVV